jgi:hypothetical protein
MSNFIPSQIVCLESKNQSLFCEVIEIISLRSLCWVRPVILVNVTENSSDFYQYTNNSKICDLRFTADLLWNIADFRVVLDTEYLDFFVGLEDFEFQEDKVKLANHKLRDFIQQLCEQKSQS